MVANDYRLTTIDFRTMKLHKLIIPTLALVLTLSSCEQSFEELEKDPNRPTNATASLVFNGILNNL